MPAPLPANLVPVDVTVVYEGAARLTDHGLVTMSGKAFEFDMIVCATGFAIQYVPHL